MQSNNSKLNVRLPPAKYRGLDIASSSPKSSNSFSASDSPKNNHCSELERNSKDASMILDEVLARSSYGPSRRAIMNINDSIKRERAERNKREHGFTLDGVGVAYGDRDLRLPSYNPFLDPKQHLFLKSPERRGAALQAYDWRTMVRDQTDVMKHNVSMLTRRSGGVISNGLAPNVLERPHHDMSHIGLASLDMTVSHKGSFCPGVSVGHSAPATPINQHIVRKTARTNLDHFERKLTTAKIQPPQPPQPETDPNSKETRLLKARFIKDHSFSPAFRRTVLVALQKSGLEVESPYSSIIPDKAEEVEEEGPEEEGGFTNLEIRQVVRFTEDCCDESKRNGRIDFQELENVFRRAQRARAAIKFEGPGKKAMLKLEDLLLSRDQDMRSWFEEVDVLHKDGLLTHDELRNALMDLKDPKQNAFNPYSLLGIGRDCQKEEVTLAWMNYNRLHQKSPTHANDFYNLDAAQQRAVGLAEAAAKKAHIAEARKKRAVGRKGDIDSEYAASPSAAVAQQKAAADKEYQMAQVEACLTQHEASELAAKAADMTHLDEQVFLGSTVLSGESDDSSEDRRLSALEADAAQEKAELARKDADSMRHIKAKQAKDPHGHVGSVQLAFETLTEPHKLKNYRKFGHPHGILKETVPPFSQHEVLNLIKYTDPNMDGKLSLTELEQGLDRAHALPEENSQEQKVGEILKKLEGRFHEDKVWGRVRELFDHLDADKSGEITVKELRRGLQNWNQKSAQERFQEKKREELKMKLALKKSNKAASEDRLKARLKEAEESGAMAVLLKLEHMLKTKVMRTVDLFNNLDADGDGDIDIDEFMDGLARAGEMELTRKETRLLVDFFDENGDGTIEVEEFEVVIRRLRKDRKRAKQLEKEKEQRKHNH